MRRYDLLALSLLAIGCTADSTRPVAPATHPQMAVAVSSADLPNVIRYRDQFANLIQDQETDLLAIAGLPADPRQELGCGGTETFTFADIHLAGLLQDAIKATVRGDGVNLHVYRRWTFENPCVSTPIAIGTGAFSYIDNNVFFTGNKSETFGGRMDGTVTLASGGTARLLAHNRWQVDKDGTATLIFRHVELR